MIHIVEDDRGVADAMVVLLAQMGHAVRIHPSAESLFACAPPGSEDGVIVDLNLPGISGGHLVRWLLALADPPLVVIVTGQSANALGTALAGVHGPVVLRKPIDPLTLCRAFGDTSPLFPALVAAETCARERA
jgi:FixJ family two-component response regulator